MTKNLKNFVEITVFDFNNLNEALIRVKIIQALMIFIKHSESIK